MPKLISCGTCGHQVSSSATQCPNCGQQFKKKTSKLTWIIAALFGLPFLMGIIMASNSNNSGNATSESSTPAKTEPSKFASMEKFDAPETEFDSDVGAKVYILEQTIKKQMKDPESAQFQNWHYVKASKKSPATFCGEVNAKNSFGGYTGFKRFFVKEDDMKFGIEDQTDNFATQYNKYCILK